MLLSNYLLSGGVKPYLEYGWVCAPNNTGQVIPNNTLTTLTIDTEVADTGNNGSISGNQITLNAGTYYFIAEAFYGCGSSDTGRIAAIFSLYNSSDNQYITRSDIGYNYATLVYRHNMQGQFTINSTKTIRLQLLANGYSNTITVSPNTLYVSLSDTGTTNDQRTTIKLWKLA
jgi:hypothetical protein